MPRRSATHPVNAVFRPRLVHFRSQYEQTPGIVVSDWTVIELSWTQTILRRALYRTRQGCPSPLGMSKLPFELLEVFFGKLCGKEVHAVRLTRTEWERASRPFFAERHLRRSLFWLTPFDLRRLKRLAAKFGPYVRNVYIATDQFTVSGVWQVWLNYKEHRDHLSDLTASVAEKWRRGFAHSRRQRRQGSRDADAAHRQRRPTSPRRRQARIRVLPPRLHATSPAVTVETSQTVAIPLPRSLQRSNAGAAAYHRPGPAHVCSDRGNGAIRSA